MMIGKEGERKMCDLMWGKCKKFFCRKRRSHFSVVRTDQILSLLVSLKSIFSRKCVRGEARERGRV